MSIFNDPAFKRGKAWAARRQELNARGMVTRKHLTFTEQLLEGALMAQRKGAARDEEHLAALMTDWLLIHEELGDDE